MKYYNRSQAEVLAHKVCNPHAEAEQIRELLGREWSVACKESNFEGKKILRISTTPDVEGNRRTFTLRAGDFLVLQQGKVVRWPGPLFESCHLPKFADGEEDAFGDDAVGNRL